MLSCLLGAGAIWGLHWLWFKSGKRYNGLFETWEYDGDNEFTKPGTKVVIKVTFFPLEVFDKYQYPKANHLITALPLHKKFSVWREALREGLKRDRANEARTKVDTIAKLEQLVAERDASP